MKKVATIGWRGLAAPGFIGIMIACCCACLAEELDYVPAAETDYVVGILPFGSMRGTPAQLREVDRYWVIVDSKLSKDEAHRAAMIVTLQLPEDQPIADLKSVTFFVRASVDQPKATLALEVRDITKTVWRKMEQITFDGKPFETQFTISDLTNVFDEKTRQARIRVDARGDSELKLGLDLVKLEVTRHADAKNHAKAAAAIAKEADTAPIVKVHLAPGADPNAGLPADPSAKARELRESWDSSFNSKNVKSLHDSVKGGFTGPSVLSGKKKKKTKRR